MPIVAFALLLTPLGCSGDSDGESTVTVLAAASLTDALREIAREFETVNPGIEVKLNFAGSQRLRSQLELGAQADVFASADEIQMQLAREAGLLSGGSQVFASASMAVIAATASTVSTLRDMSTSGTKVVLAHESVPAGTYSRELLQLLSGDDSGLGADYAERVLANVVSNEPSVKFVEQKVVLGQADAGIVYRPGVLTAVADNRAREIPLPSHTEVKARYPIAVLSNSANRRTARLFIEFVLSESAQEILAGYGFGPP